jgi:signal transduction histidine kinase
MRSLAARFSFAFVVLLLAFGLLVALLTRQVFAAHEDETLQRLSHGLAAHIVGHWPDITLTDPDAAERAAREELLTMLSAVNPSIQVYVLDADGRVDAYIGEPGMVREFQVDLEAIRAFLSGADLPLRGTDPMGSGRLRLFSAAMFPPRPGDLRPPGYLYIVLDGASRDLVSGELGTGRFRNAALAGSAAALVLTMCIGLVLVARLSRPLRRLAARIASYGDQGAHEAPVSGDEVAAIDAAFVRMTQRLEEEARRRAAADAAHRETLAGVAHDLKTPLTALYGQLEALSGIAADDPGLRQRLLMAALGQSDRVRRLSHQLFELAALEGKAEMGQGERFLVDELVSDAVQKFDGLPGPGIVHLDNAAPGPLEVEGDIELVERAITNLIDNALRHAGQHGPVEVSLRREGRHAEILVADRGPGLPQELLARLNQGDPLWSPELRRARGGIGGLGLAIAQKVAFLHGGALRSATRADGVNRMCLALPLAA